MTWDLHSCDGLLDTLSTHREAQLVSNGENTKGHSEVVCDAIAMMKWLTSWYHTWLSLLVFFISLEIWTQLPTPATPTAAMSCLSSWTKKQQGWGLDGNSTTSQIHTMNGKIPLSSKEFASIWRLQARWYYTNVLDIYSKQIIPRFHSRQSCEHNRCSLQSALTSLRFAQESYLLSETTDRQKL